MQLANSMLNNTRPRAAHSQSIRHFSLLMYDLKTNTINSKYVTDFYDFVVSDFFEDS